MLLNSLIFLLLSNSITSRRDKSILYARATIIILLTSTLVAYDNLSVLSLVIGLTQSRIKRLFAFSTISHVGFILLDIISYIWLSFLGLKVYISCPTKVFLLSNNMQMSSFYTGKGKGKSESAYPDENKTKSESESSDLDNDKELNKAIMLSLQQDTAGESSKENLQDKENSSVEINQYELIAGYTQSWKELKDRIKNSSILHNKLKIELDKKTIKDESDVEKLGQYREEVKQLNHEVEIIQKKLLQYGVNPSEQYNYDTESDTGSEYSSEYSSDKASSNGSNNRFRKRAKYSHYNNYTDVALVFSTFNIGLNIWFLIHFLSIVCSVVFLLIIELNIFPDFTIYPINIILTQLLSLHLVINFIKLIYKSYKIVIQLYISYLNKDYLILYINLYLTSILIIILLSSNLDIGIFYY